MRKERLNELLVTAERHTQAGRLSRAVAFYRKALTLARIGESEWELAQVRLGDIHMLRGELEPAIAHLTRACELGHAEPRHAMLLGRALRLAGQPERASAYLMDACQCFSDRGTALIELAHATADLGHREAARTMVGLVARHHPEHPQLRGARRYASDA